MAGRSADGELQHEVDLLILDYLACMATIAILTEYNARTTNVPEADFDKDKSERLLSMVDCKSAEVLLSYTRDNDIKAFLLILRDKPNPTVIGDLISFRLKALQTISLFAGRLAPGRSSFPSTQSLQRLRQDNQQRCQRMLRSRSDLKFDTVAVPGLPIEDEILQRNARNMLSKLNLPGETAALYRSGECLSLLDLLPSFIALSAQRAQLDDTSDNTEGGDRLSADITTSDYSLQPLWMEITAEFMLQAVLEQYLILGADKTDVVVDAFAWAYTPVDDSENKEDSRMIAIFAQSAGADETLQEVEGWTAIRGKYLHLLDVPENVPVAVHLEGLAVRFPVTDFEERIISFYICLVESLPKPVLIQLESGRLDGFSAEETEQLQKRAGITK